MQFVIYGKKYLYVCKILLYLYGTGGAVVESWAADLKNVSLPPACAL
jgi:hypothetical protein